MASTTSSGLRRRAPGGRSHTCSHARERRGQYRCATPADCWCSGKRSPGSLGFNLEARYEATHAHGIDVDTTNVCHFVPGRQLLQLDLGAVWTDRPCSTCVHVGKRCFRLKKARRELVSVVFCERIVPTRESSSVSGQARSVRHADAPLARHPPVAQLAASSAGEAVRQPQRAGDAPHASLRLPQAPSERPSAWRIARRGPTQTPSI